MTGSPPLDVLLPLDRAGQRLEPRDDEDELLALFGDDPARLVRANMITTLDGGGTGPDAVTGSINGPADLRVFQVLRSLAEVVLVGGGTVRQERYRALDVPKHLAGQRARRGLPEHIELAVVSRSGALPDELLDAGRPPFVVTAPGCPVLDPLRERLGADHVVVSGGPEGVDLAAALDALAALGLGRVLTEGGPSLLGQLVDAGLVDELCLTWSPVLVGGPAPRILEHPAWLSPARRLRPAHLLHADGVLLGRWRAS
ncbi:dihydrofolate reductase family protein [Cellulomonas edaphi]|uniref:Dihydrofolate reductase family protein n=1 Tax=Cellulomonas edaphi TaxID=3053468 RepID=A0ABT7S6V1_9CELL|nr:dihydrofolate reductase family protein [Cellulomons edaphi]MDM7831347.1 dihydrofolate reductase family protein [Cellulomons edaphi]